MRRQSYSKSYITFRTLKLPDILLIVIKTTTMISTKTIVEKDLRNTTILVICDDVEPQIKLFILSYCTLLRHWKLTID